LTAPALAASAVPAPLVLEAAFASARKAARAAADPAAVLRDPGAALDDRLAAVDALQSRVPYATAAQQKAAVEALLAAAQDTRQPAAVRAKALTYLGYALARVGDEAVRVRAFPVLFSALEDPAYRLFSLRGLGPASHALPEAQEAACLDALLALLAGPSSGEERATALVDVLAFVGSREDLAKRKPALAAELDARLLVPIEADPAAFVKDPRSTPAARELQIAAVWTNARHRQAAGDAAPAARVKALLERLKAVETDPTVGAWIETYLSAPPPPPPARDSTTKRLGPDEP